MPQMPTITAQLVHIHGPLKGQIQDFSQFPVQIGRHSSCQVRFDKDLTTISRLHARIERQGNRFRIVDASTNGTFVNGKRIADVYLRDGDVITFSEDGPKSSFLTQIEAGMIPGRPEESVQDPAPQAPCPDSGLTMGPDFEIPVISDHAPLVIQYGPVLQSFDILPVVIGSDPACDFIIAGRSLAAQHALIFFSEGAYYIKDLSGSDSVTINGRPIGIQSVLAQGAELWLTDQGPAFRFLSGGRLAEIQDGACAPRETASALPELPDKDA